ncbi:Cbb3-type cytochrome oxidase, cytochrome c subunit [Terriglobus roseus DSM 18391]|uniref:Cbb3-type cytochrome oxidase, cytochrome c subunit n=1 Tax=Terriglobus roseus (strain DSM 18391 / NRRL B-41598 / KBS 63) TaxID=926566 RepID=I3ZMI6_TERRK|nr:cbb3-type cytochrome c oxidase subunit II [Terriglobus roseus]AFL90454.1 Cbb3-type cytochrome oxidase, cytochrome c subunit [Terriglobus roseus DSM 18391]
MSALRGLTSGWRAVCLIAITYVYFLIFAQFAFLNRLGQLGIEDAHLQAVMATMALAGIVFSLIAAFRRFAPAQRLGIAFLLCGMAASASILRLNLAGAIAVAFCIGAGLGLLTVTLVSNLDLWVGTNDGIAAAGLGTGLGYFFCNIPALFTASPHHQSFTAAILCLLGYAVAQRANARPSLPTRNTRASAIPFAFALVGLTALVWLDSAAFFIIQNTPTLKAGTWEGNLHLWTNACLHLGAALLSAYLLRRRGTAFVLCSAVLALAIACILLHDPARVVLASLFYPIGVSLYSVALVAYPSFLAESGSATERSRKAGLIYAIAGWFGSAMGIGMGQHLKQVPIPFVAVAVLCIFGTTLFRLARTHRKEMTVVSLALIGALCLYLPQNLTTQSASPSSAVERGRRVYIAEGCIHCHSQYIRPNTADILTWGPAMTLAELRAQNPPLIGNRRQGPDLSQVGGRRSPLWLKAHFFDPDQVSRASFMPSYRYLFQDATRGDDLVQYLANLRSPNYPDHLAAEQAWHLSASSIANADADKGALLYGDHCATCHEVDGATRAKWSSSFKRLPPSLHDGPWQHVHLNATPEARIQQLAQIVRFGIPQTDMPGHEYLSDQDISSIVLWLNQSIAPNNGSIRPGENL